MIGMPGPTELIIILVIVMLIFGGGKLAGVGKSLGTAIRDFKDAVSPEDEAKEKEKKSGGALGNEKRAGNANEHTSSEANAEHRD